MFLENHFDPQLSFCDVQEITQHSAIDMRSSSRVVIPQVDIFWAGFSCKSRSRANPKAARFVNCLQKHDGEAETSATYDAVMTYLKKMRPSLVLFENVIGLMQAAPGQLSDADFVLHELNAAGHGGGAQRAGYVARRESDSSPLLLRAIRMHARLHRQAVPFRLLRDWILGREVATVLLGMPRRWRQPHIGERRFPGLHHSPRALVVLGHHVIDNGHRQHARGQVHHFRHPGGRQGLRACRRRAFGAARKGSEGAAVTG